MAFELSLTDGITTINLGSYDTYLTDRNSLHIGDPVPLRSTSQSILRDGFDITAHAFSQRTITASVTIRGATASGVTGALQRINGAIRAARDWAISRRGNRWRLKYNPGGDAPTVYFTIRDGFLGAPVGSVDPVWLDADLPVLRNATLTLTCDPLAEGEAVTLSNRTINSSFEADLSGWSIDASPLFPPQDLQGTGGSASIALSWTAPNYTNVTSYEYNYGQNPASAPDGLEGDEEDGQVTIRWEAQPDNPSITGYSVQVDSGPWDLIAGSDGGTTEHTITSLTNGTEITVGVRAQSGVDGDVSTVTLTPTADTTMQDTVTGTRGDVANPWDTISDDRATSFTISGLTDDDDETIYLRAVNASGKTPWAYVTVTVNDGVTTDGTTRGPAGATGGVTRSTTEAYYGNSSAKMAMTSGQMDQYVRINQGLSNISTGDIFSVSCWVQVESLSNCNLVFEVGSSTGASTTTNVTEVGGWRRLTLDNLTATADAPTLKVELVSTGASGTGVAYVDGVMANEGAAASRLWVSSRRLTNVPGKNYLDIHELPGDYPAKVEIKATDVDGVGRVWLALRKGDRRTDDLEVQGEEFAGDIVEVDLAGVSGGSYGAVSHGVAMLGGCTVATDDDQSSFNVSSASSHTFTDKVDITSTVDNRVLVLDYLAIGGSGTPPPLTSITIGDDDLAMTQIGSAVTGQVTTNGYASLQQWYLANPPSGEHDVVINWTAPATGFNVDAIVRARCLSNVDPTTPVRVTTTDSGDLLSPRINNSSLVVGDASAGDITLSSVIIENRTTLGGFPASARGTVNYQQAGGQFPFGLTGHGFHVWGTSQPETTGGEVTDSWSASVIPSITTNSVDAFAQRATIFRAFGAGLPHPTLASPEIVRHTPTITPAGVFRVLARVRSSMGASYLGFGYSYGGVTAGPSRESDYTLLSESASWRLVDFGQLIIPPQTLPEGARPGPIEFELSVWRAAGTNVYTTDIDYIMLLPIDEGVAYLSKTTTAGDVIAVSDTVSIQDSSGAFKYIPQHQGGEMTLSTEGTRLYLVGTGDTDSIATTMEVVVVVTPRYSVLG